MCDRANPRVGREPAELDRLSLFFHREKRFSGFLRARTLSQKSGLSERICRLVFWTSGVYTIAQMNTALNTKLNATAFAKANIGLGDVDNTADANKLISASTQSALNSKLDILSFTKSGIGA